MYTQLAWPSARALIERLLLARPQSATRNWSPHETPEDLARENLEHAVPLEPPPPLILPLEVP